MVRRLLLFLLLAASVASLRADTLTFTNGDRLSGTLTRADASGCVFKSAMAGTVTVPWKKIRELTTDTVFVVVSNAGKVDRGRIDAGAERIRVDGDVVATAELHLIVDPKTYANRVARAPRPWQGWRGQLSGGFSQVSATQSSLSYTANVDINRPTPQLDWLPRRSDTVIHIQEAYGKLSAVGQPTVRTSIFGLGLEQDQDLTPRLFVFGTARFDHNYAQGLQLQQSYGGGVGWKLMNSAATRLELKADLHWTDQRFLSNARERFLASSFGENLRQTYGKIVWTQSLSLTPSYTQGLAYQMAGLTSWAVPLYNAFSLNFTVVDNFLNNPQPGYQKNTLQVSTGLQYTLF